MLAAYNLPAEVIQASQPHGGCVPCQNVVVLSGERFGFKDESSNRSIHPLNTARTFFLDLVYNLPAFEKFTVF